MRWTLAFVSGLIFGLGLLASGMTSPRKVQAFLDIFGSWDPSLALVMAGAIGVAAFAMARARARERAWCGDLIEWPSSESIDRQLILGGVLFGVGWGLAGFCPGPAIVAMGSGMSEAWVFGIAMLTGMAMHDKLFP
jgi:uncharacterized membrane protein YedE/YeeE